MVPASRDQGTLNSSCCLQGVFGERVVSKHRIWNQEAKTPSDLIPPPPPQETKNSPKTQHKNPSQDILNLALH